MQRSDNFISPLPLLPAVDFPIIRVGVFPLGESVERDMELLWQQQERNQVRHLSAKALLPHSRRNLVFSMNRPFPVQTFVAYATKVCRTDS